MYLKTFLLLSVFFVTQITNGYNFSDIDIIQKNKYIPKSYQIKNLQFAPQAPLAVKSNWLKHYESCEEMALFLSHYNINNIDFTRKYADREIDKINDFQENILKIEKNKKHNKKSRDILYLRDISILEIQKIAKEFYGYNNSNSHILDNPSEKTLKYLISKGYILIIPSHTDILKNKFNSPDTHSYHVINLVGYYENNFISYDPGTSRGKNYKYSNIKIMKGIKNYGNKILILEGKRNKKNINFKYLHYKSLHRHRLTYNRLNKFLISRLDLKKQKLRLLSNVRFKYFLKNKVY